jgi:MFS family permease
MTGPNRLFTFEYVGICLVSFFALCNFTAFYDLFHYLDMLGVPHDVGGLVVGSYSLTAMVLFLVVSPFLHPGNATRTMLLGIVLLVATGVSYLFVHSLPGLVALRMIGGAGQFCLGSGAMALLVSVIPSNKSGQAFGFYSTAILVAFASVPALMDAFAPFARVPPYGFAAATLTLLPAAWIVLRIQARQRDRLAGAAHHGHLPSWADVRANATQPIILLLIVVHTTYFINWSSIFFLFKGFARLQGIGNVGAFFTVQMIVMMAIRLLGGRLFDRLDKMVLAGISFTLVAVGHLALHELPGPWAIAPIAVLFGIGMGAGYPAINGYMFEVSEPRFRALNANLMLFAVQAGSFLGPSIGGGVVARGGYGGYFVFSIVLALGSAALLPLVSRQRRTALENGR